MIETTISENKKIKVIDSIMGSGKTSWSIQFMNENSVNRYIYVTPYLNEVQRIKNEVVNIQMIDPDVKYGRGSKFTHFKQLIKKGENIVTTHSLFSLINCNDVDLIKNIKKHGYILIFDEVIELIEQHSIEKSDIDILKKDEMISVTADGLVNWIKKSYDGDKFENEKMLAENGNLYCDGNKLFRVFPHQLFNLFTDIYIMTYLFEYQLQAYYCNMFNLTYETYYVDKMNDRYELIELDTNDRYHENREELKKLINIYEDKGKSKLNTNYMKSDDKITVLSVNWFKHAEKDQIDTLKKNLVTYFKNSTSGKLEFRLWTCLKNYKTKLSGKGYTKAFIPLNLRATNEHQNTKDLAYVYNRYMNPNEKHLYNSHGVSVYEDGLAVSELLQWVWRSRVRNGESINIYLPSERMRNLFKDYLEYKI
jgi:hypothetical protein